LPSSSPPATVTVVSPLAAQFPIAHQCQAARCKKRRQARRKDCRRRVQEGFFSQGVADAALNMDMDAKSQGGPNPMDELS
jgi:hypothetical protein